MAAQDVRIVTAAATMQNWEDVIVFNSAAAIDFQLLPAVGDGREFLLKNIGAGAVTLLPDGDDLVDGGTSKVLSQGCSQTLVDYTAEGWLLTEDAIVTGDLTAALGAAPTPVVRTKEPIIGANTINANIDALDAAIGADHTPLTRTVGLTAVANTINANIDALDTVIGSDAQLTAVARTTGPVVTSQSVMQNIDDLDAAIGADHTPLTRTVGLTAVANTVNANIDALDTAIGSDAQLTAVARTAGPVAVANSVMQNIDALDSAIGFDAQMSGTPNVVDKTGTVFQALDKLDTYKSFQTVKKTIGGVGVAGCDFNFATAENQTEQPIDLGAIIPARAKIVSVSLFSEAEFTGAISLGCKVGVGSGGDSILTSTNMFSATAVGDSGLLTSYSPTRVAEKIWVSATPGANWSNVTAGKVSVYVNFINVTNI